MPLFLFCLKELWFFIIPICICINSIRKMLGNQIVLTSSIKGIPFSNYLNFHSGVVFSHANWANLIDLGVQRQYIIVYDEVLHIFKKELHKFAAISGLIDN